MAGECSDLVEIVKAIKISLFALTCDIDATVSVFSRSITAACSKVGEEVFAPQNKVAKGNLNSSLTQVLGRKLCFFKSSYFLKRFDSCYLE